MSLFSILFKGASTRRLMAGLSSTAEVTAHGRHASDMAKFNHISSQRGLIYRMRDSGGKFGNKPFPTKQAPAMGDPTSAPGASQAAQASQKASSGQAMSSPTNPGTWKLPGGPSQAKGRITGPDGREIRPGSGAVTLMSGAENSNMNKALFGSPSPASAASIASPAKSIMSRPPTSIAGTMGKSAAVGGAIGGAVGMGSEDTGFIEGITKGALIGATGGALYGKMKGRPFKSPGAPEIPSGASRAAGDL